jgi:linoleoyl-CoA desaturase
MMAASTTAAALASGLLSRDSTLGLESPWTKPLRPRDQDVPLLVTSKKAQDAAEPAAQDDTTPTTTTSKLPPTKMTSSEEDGGVGGVAATKKGEGKVYTLEELDRHKGPESFWMAVGDSVYDISSFVLSDRHPGGDLIYQGVGREATVLFRSAHPARTNAVLAKYYIGELQRPDTGFQYNWDSKFYDVLQERVEAYFKETNTSRRGSPWLWVQAVQTIVFFSLFLYLGYFQGSLLACVCMGWFYSQFGIVMMHDGAHGAFSSNPTISKLASLIMDVMGSSSLVWKHEHNIGHHQYTNTTQDPDATTAYPLVRYHPSQPWHGYHRYQHLYVWLLYPFVVYKWYLSDILFVIKGQYRSIPMYTPPTSYLILFAITKAFLPFWVIFLPIYLHGFVYGLLCMAVAFCTASYSFAMQFVITHLADDVAFPEESNLDNDWAKCQVYGSSNYSTNNPVATWLSGGLNFQVEHHLFPTIAHTRLPEIAPIVKRTCAEFGLPYFEHESFWSALCHHYQHMRRMSVRPAHAAAASKPQPKAAKSGVLLFSSCALVAAVVGIVAHICC